MNDWEYIKEFYKQHFGIDNWVVEMMANRDILLLCASGASNRTISTFLDISQDEIELVIKESFDFIGWKEDLPVNPYRLYSNVLGSFDEFYKEMKNSNVFELRAIEDVHSICRTMKEIEERIYDEWI